MSEYDPLLPVATGERDDDLERARDLFAAASRPFLVSPWPWVAWALLLPAAALATPAILVAFGGLGVLGLWSLTILLGGAVELGGIRRGRRRHGRTALAGWALSVQGNLSVVAIALSLALLWAGLGRLLPGAWLLLLGHSFYLMGSLAFPPFRAYGLLYQLGGAVALWPVGVDPFLVFAVVTAAGNAWMAWSVWRR
ncbi:MAG TPA: hypothetical protein VGV61_12130 [Thermoanaerobaculia bacterium]|jgi:hypothetical protein|nr:hypothetical protein [Thermoanaerobaculia bacterium]